MSHQRRLDHEEKMEAAKIIEIKVNKQLLQQCLKSNTGKVVILKVMTKIIKLKYTNVLTVITWTLVQCLKDMEGISPLHKKLVYSSLSIQVLQLNITLMTRKCLQIQHINEFHIPLYLLVIVDGNGQSEIIGMCLTTQETQEAIMKMTRCLKSHNLSRTIQE